MCVIARTPRIFNDPPRDVLIFAAHSDDCVIVGAEYALYAAEQGFSVRIVYLTCSGPNPDAGISDTRKNEAVTAWRDIGVSVNNLTFINLPQSNIHGPIGYTADEIERARDVFRSSLFQLPNHSAIIIPSNGESHVDHRTVRALALDALRKSKRADLIIYESPEYNNNLSIIYAPEKTIRTILRFVPLINRLIRKYSGPANFIDGPKGAIFSNVSYLAKKQELLMYFLSQNGSILKNHFGHSTLYRKVNLSRTETEPLNRTRFRAFGHQCDLSVLVWGLGVGVAIFSTAYATADQILRTLPPQWSSKASSGLIFFSLSLGWSYLARMLNRRASMESALFMGAGIFGLVLASIQ